MGITDGDTFKLLTHDSILVKVRLANIDCPEKKQPYSQQAKAFASQAIFGKTVCIEILKKDRYRRSIATVFYDDSLTLNSQLVKHGLACHYIKYSNNPYLQKLENEARKKKIGLWQETRPIPPWEWRGYKKKN